MIELRDLISGVQGLQIHGPENPVVKEMTLDSREVESRSLFCAIKGSAMDGHDFIDQSISKGASTILCEDLPKNPNSDITYIVCDDIRKSLGQVASIFFGEPSKHLKIVAITGTNGKTSIATWLYDLVRSMGYAAGLLSTIRILIEGKEHPSSHTTPDVITLNRYLARMVEAGCEFVFMEASSHALDQRRTAGISFTGAVFTNISRDHLDYHIDFQAYIAAKKLLFDELSPEAFALINEDDKNGRVMLQNSAARKYSYSLVRPADYHLKVQEQHADGMSFILNNNELWVRILGLYNAQNLAAVYGSARLLDFEDADILAAMSSLQPVEGRLEIVQLGRKITGIVDYAHTPDALENVLSALDEVKTAEGRVITVVGAGGDRDAGKRPKMARAAIKGSNQVILTSDNPRTEDPEKILNDMEAGVNPEDQSRVLRISDRAAAIKTAVTLAQPGDIVLVAGKGHESYQEIKGVRHSFDDVEELKKLIYKD